MHQPTILPKAFLIFVLKIFYTLNNTPFLRLNQYNKTAVKKCQLFPLISFTQGRLLNCLALQSTVCLLASYCNCHCCFLLSSKTCHCWLPTLFPGLSFHHYPHCHFGCSRYALHLFFSSLPHPYPSLSFLKSHWKNSHCQTMDSINSLKTTALCPGAMLHSGSLTPHLPSSGFALCLLFVLTVCLKSSP